MSSITSDIGERASQHRRYLVPAVIGLLAVHALLALSSVHGSSATCDEVAHLTAGYSYWTTGDWRLVPEHPPLAQLWAAAPLLLMDLQFPSTAQKAWHSSNQWQMGTQFFYESGNDTETMLLAARSMIVLLSVGLGLVVFAWSRRLFGAAGGLLSLLLYVFSPTLLAHGALVTTDLAAALFFLLAAGAWGAVLARVTVWRVLLGGFVLAGLLLAKMSGLLIIPIALALLVLRLLLPRSLPIRLGRTFEIRSRAGRFGVLAGTAVVQVLVAWGLIWAAYGFRCDAFRAQVEGRDDFASVSGAAPYESSWEAELRDLGTKGEVIRTLRDHRFLPESYLYGLAYTLNSTHTRSAFLNGEQNRHGFVMFFPFCFAAKTPLPLFAVLGLALLAVGLRRAGPPGVANTSDPMWYRTAPLWMLALVYIVAAVGGNLNIGHRHLLPIYPVVFILCGAAGGLLTIRRVSARVAVLAVAICYVAASLWAWPHYLAYFNQLAGGPRHGYRHLVDSSLDWGQDLARLATWLDRREDTATAKNTYISYCGNASLVHHGIDARRLPCFPFDKEAEAVPLGAGTYCISATTLQQVYLLPTSRWTRALEETYQRYLPQVLRLGRSAEWANASPVSQVEPLELLLLRKLRFARLCASLRQREPDDHAGYSILIYELTEADIDAALQGPPPELYPDRAQNLCDFALKLGRAGGGGLADRFLAEAAALAPRDPYVRSWVGFTLQRQGRMRKAYEHLHAAAEVDPRYPGVWAGLGRCLAQEGRLAEALDAFQRALRGRPRDAETHLHLAFARAGLGRWGEALESARTAVSLRPRDPSVRLCLADMCLQTGQTAEALTLFEQLVEELPRDVRVHVELANLRAAHGRHDEAVAEYERALALDETQVAAHYNLGLTLMHLGRFERALATLENALSQAEAQGLTEVIPAIQRQVEQARSRLQTPDP